MPLNEPTTSVTLPTFCLVVVALCFASSNVAFGQLDVEFSADVTLDEDGIYTYSYSLFNDDLNIQSINSILLTTAMGAPVITIIGPNDNWFASYAAEEELFQAGFATGLSANGENCGATDQFDVFPGQTVSFSIASPWAPANQSFAVGRTVGNGAACDFVGDFATGLIASPSTAIDECDFDRDGNCGTRDLDILSTAIAQNIKEAKFDLNLDTLVSFADLELFLELSNRLNGDTDFNGNVEFADFLVLSGSFAKDATWTRGDFDANGNVGFADFLILSSNFGKSSGVAAAVPEPTTQCSVLIAMAVACTALRNGQGHVRPRTNSN